MKLKWLFTGLAAGLIVSGPAVLSIPLHAFAQSIEPGREGVLANVLKPVPGQRICFSRSYSKDHLDAHPKQKVTDIRFQLAYHRHKPDEFSPNGQRNYYFRLLAKLRGSSKTLTGVGECSASGVKIFCGIECDGGGINIRTRPAGKLLVYFGDTDSISLSESCDGGDENRVELKAGADDREFLLNPVAASACPAYEKW